MPPIYVSFNEKLIQLSIRQKKEIIATIFKIGVCSFELVNEISYTCKQYTKILSARSVLEELTGELIPCFLIQQSYSLYIFALNSDLTKFIPLRKVSDPEILVTEFRVLILDGPSLLFTSSASVLVLHSDDSEMCILKKKCYNLVSEKHCCLKNEAATSNESHASSNPSMILHASTTSDGYLLFLKEHRMCKCAHTKSGLFILLFSSVNGFTELNKKDFIPEEYHSNLTCLYHFNLNEVYESFIQTTHKIIGTSDGFVIEVENGSLQRCVPLCSETLLPIPKPIENMYFCTSKLCGNNNDTLLVIIQEHRAVALNKKLKIIKTWAGITKLFQCGYTDTGLQLFLLFRGNTIKDGWILTDLNSVEFSSGTSVPEQDAKTESSESLGSAIEALQKRFQGETLVLYEKEQQSRRRERFLREEFSRQVQLLEGRKPALKTNKPDLLPLIGPSQINVTTAGNQQQRLEEDADIEIVDIWQRTYHETWLVAVSFRNKTDSNLQVSISLIPSCRHGAQDHLSCRSTQVLSRRTQKLPKEPEIGGTKAKYPRTEIGEERINFKDFSTNNNYHEPDIAVCKTGLPNFGGSNSYSASVFVKWIRRDTCVSSSERNVRAQDGTAGYSDGGAAGDSDVERNQRTKTGNVFTKYCGEVVLKVEDFISGKYEIGVFTDLEPYDVEMQDLKDMKRDATALAMIQRTSLLDLKSTPTILTSLDQLLIDRCHFTYNQRLDCYITRVPVLTRVQLQLGTYTGGDKRTVKAYTSCEKELFLLVHHLYASLPDHVIILHQSPSASDIIQSCLPSLQKELSFIEHGVRKLLDDTDHKESESADDKVREEDIRKVGEKFKRQKEKVMEKMTREVNKDKLRDLYEQLMSFAEETDSTIVKELSKH